MNFVSELFAKKSKMKFGVFLLLKVNLFSEDLIIFLILSNPSLALRLLHYPIRDNTILRRGAIKICHILNLTLKGDAFRKRYSLL
jgi:hypothetical protein